MFSDGQSYLSTECHCTIKMAIVHRLAIMTSPIVVLKSLTQYCLIFHVYGMSVEKYLSNTFFLDVINTATNPK